jgi:hypothetical protein
VGQWEGVTESQTVQLRNDMKAPFHSLAAGVLLATTGTGLGQPAIMEQPQSCTNIAGTTATFTVAATGTLPLAYQWQWGQSGYYFYDRTDCTNTILVLTNVRASDALDYRVIITNVDGAITSDVATLTVLLPPTNVKVTPTNSSVSLGANLTLRVTAAGTTPFGYQWCLNCTPLSGRTNGALTLTNVRLADAGPYTVVVTNVAGGSTSAAVTLQVDPTFTKITTGPLVTDISHWHGAVWGDYNNDGYPDLFVHDVNAPYDYIYRNKGDGTFTRLTAPIPQGLTAGDGAWANACGDYDNDGHLDLFIVNAPGVNLLLHNRGDGTFEHILTGPGAESTAASSAGWVDYDRDGYLDLFVVNSYKEDTAGRNTLYHNQGDGTFGKMTANQVGPIVSGSAIWTAASWVDFNDDGWPDLFAATVNSSPFLYNNLANGRFGLVTSSALVASSMPSSGCAWADYDNDGRLDLCIGGYGTPTIVFHNEGAGSFKKMSAAVVGIPVGDKSWGGGVAWGDYDNDGYVDLFVAGGWWNGAPVYTKSFLYHNNGDGTFTPVRTGSPVNDVTDSNGAYWVDYNRDGFLDLFVWVHGHEPVSAPNLLYRNNGNSNNWLCVTCVGTSSPRDGTGAKVRAKATIRGKEMWQLRLINSGGTAWGGQSFISHFGLGDATNVDVLRIEWTSGTVQELYNVPAKQYLTVTEPTKLSMPSPGEVHIQCWKGMAYRLEGSPDLSAWTPITTVANLTGKLQWTDTNALDQSARFFRAVKQ